MTAFSLVVALDLHTALLLFTERISLLQPVQNDRLQATLNSRSLVTCSLHIERTQFRIINVSVVKASDCIFKFVTV